MLSAIPARLHSYVLFFWEGAQEDVLVLKLLEEIEYICTLIRSTSRFEFECTVLHCVILICGQLAYFYLRIKVLLG